MLILANMRNLPESAAQSKKIMDRWTKAIAIISGIFVLMAVMIYLYKLILDTMVGGVYTPYLIRMNVNGASSFNTNFMGFLKYRSLSINLYDAYKWSLIRLIFTVINLLFFIAMFIRMIILAGLVIIAPATSIGEMINIPLNRNNSVVKLLNFKVFIKVFIITLWGPVLISVINLVLLKL